MKDIDFDELDRAVGSVLGNKTAPETTATTVTVPQPVAAAPPAVAVPSAGTSTVEKPRIGTVTPARRRGQFLDMVHPSANMRTKTTLPTGVRKTLSPLAITPQPSSDRHAVSDAPASPSVHDTEKEPLPVAPIAPEPEATPSEPLATPSEVSDSPDVIQPVDDQPSDDSHETADDDDMASWPDPLDFDDATKNESVEVPEVDGVETEAETTEPVQTPFVVDAKVDKRPLGAFADAEPAAEADLPMSQDEPTRDVSDMPELATDVNSIEAAGITAPSESVDPEPSVEPAEKPAHETAQPAVSGFGQSISQQYKSAPAVSDTAQHPLFDTHEYHQPLLPDGKKKSRKGVFIIVLVLVLLVVGGALGYLAYSMGI